MTNKSSLAVLGFGRLGACLAIAARQAGYPIAAVTAAGEATRAAAVRYGFSVRKSNIDAAASGDVIILCVPDRQIEPVCRELVAGGRLRVGQVLLHTSGANAASLLAPAKATGVSIGALHPLQSFSDAAEAAQQFSNIFFAIDGEQAAAAAASELAQALGGQVLYVPPQERALYHAAAVTASNYLVSLLSVSERLFSRWTPNGRALDAVLPLAEGTLRNIRRQGTSGALTGPIARGDIETVAKHLQALPPDLIPLYKTLGLAALAMTPSNLSTVQQLALRQLLQTPINKEELPYE